MQRLFDDFERTNPFPAKEGEDSFSFMNRVAQPFWERIRSELDEWFAVYPPEDAKDLRSRFRDQSPAQHYAAWWELYLHELFRRLGFEIEVHPELEGVSGRPDFRVARDDAAFYVEAATTFSGIVGDATASERAGSRHLSTRSQIRTSSSRSISTVWGRSGPPTERSLSRCGIGSMA